MDTNTQLTQLAKLREPFPEHQISKLNRGNGIVLDYVGHAALTDRLLTVDPLWSWEPYATAQDGSPLIDKRGGMWIKLTICGMTRLGYGCAEARGNKQPGDLVKELIGDALRNAGMRFGMALDLWHKGDLHKDDQHEERNYEPRQTRQYRMEEPPQRHQAPPQREYDDVPPSEGDFDTKYTGDNSSDWRKFPFPIPGPKKDMPIGRLSDKDLWYWIENYKPKAQYPDNLRFRDALDAARAELGESDVAVQQRNPPARNPLRNGPPAQPMHEAGEDDIPF